MTLTLDVPADVKNGLEVKAEQKGISLDLYILEVLRRDATDTLHPAYNLQNRRDARRALEALAAGTRAGLPPISDEALSRANIYAGRGQ